MRQHRLQAGFSIIELMVVLMILSITAVYAIPAFTDFIKSNRMRASEADIVTAIQFARAEAVQRGTSIELSAIDASDNGNEWGAGLRVWFDADDDDTYDAGEEIRIVRGFHSSMTLNGDPGTSRITFRPTGMTDMAANLVITVCDDRTGEIGRQMQVLNTGVVSTNSNFTGCP